MNLPELEKIIQLFNKISDMDIAILDADYRNLVHGQSDTGFCSYIHKSPKCLDCCLASDIKNLREVTESKRLVKYTCPFGIYEAIAPVMKNGNVAAYLFLSMGLEESENVHSELSEKVLSVNPKANEEALKALIDRIPRYSKEKLDAFAEMLPIIAEYIEINDMMSDNNLSIAQMIKEYVKSNISKKITLADISYSLHCSTVTLTNHFKAEFGITIMEYVTEKRMNLARHFLLSGSYSVREIAEKCGYSDTEYFSKCFKAYYGDSPLVWKRKHQG